jgi:hypothetical protein
MTENGPEPILVVVDTTELWKSLELVSAGWPQILAWCKAALIEVAIPDVTLQESGRHYEQDEARRLRKIVKDLSSLDFLPDVLLPSEDDLQELIEERISDYPRRLRALLSESSVVVLPLPNVGHDAVVRRDLESRKPFQQSGKGYRDTLNWESLMEHLRGQTESKRVIFVSSNSHDFADTNKQRLDESLEIELSATGHDGVYVQTLKDAVEYLREDVRQLSGQRDLALFEPEPVIELMKKAVIDAVQHLYGESVETVNKLDSRYEAAITLDWLPVEFIDISIQQASPDEESLDLDIYDVRDGDTYLAHASIDVELNLDGFVHKADYGENRGLKIFDRDWNDHYMNVGLTETVRLTWYLTVIGNSVEDVSFDSAESIDIGGDEDLPGFQGWTPQGTPIQDI